MNQETYTFEDLLAITRRLCGPDGCPWDRTQTHQSLRRFAIEEAYELVDAINSGNPKTIADESGDLLFQVMIHACLAEQNGTYTMEDVLSAICKKMIRRHPDVFGLDGPKDWDAIKRKEKGHTSLSEELSDIPATFSALMRAEKLQKKLSKANAMPTTLPHSEDAELQAGEALFNLVAQCQAQGSSAESALFSYTNYVLKTIEETKGDSL